MLIMFTAGECYQVTGALGSCSQEHSYSVTSMQNHSYSATPCLVQPDAVQCITNFIFTARITVVLPQDIFTDV